MITPDEAGNAVTVKYRYNGYDTAISNAHVKDPYWEKTRTTDHLGRIVRIIEHAEAGDQTTAYAYNAAGDLTRVTNALGHVTAITYNTLSRKVQMDDPDMGMWSYRYDANGNLIAQTDTREHTIAFGYDKRNRLISKTYPEGAGQPDAVYTYCLEDTAANRADNRVNRLQTVDTGDVTTEYLAYDPMGRVGRVRKSITGDARCKRKYAETAYDYDLSGKVAVICYPEDDMDDKDDEENYDVEYLYYPGSGLIKAIVDSEDRTLAAFDDYPASGKIGHITFHNQVKTDYVYSPFSLRLESITTMDRDSQPLMDKSYGYTLAGDIEDINDSVNAVNFSYTYDRLHRLVGEDASAPMETTPMVIDFIYDDDARPLHAAATVKVNGRIQEDIAYDANGNMTRGWNLAEPESVKPRNIEYNADNMPVSVTNGDAETRFIYDADGSRARKKSRSGSTYYFGDHFEYINGTPTRYVFAGNLRIAKVTPCKIHYFHKDHLGSSTVISTASGKKEDVESTAYLPYGGQRGAGGISRSSYRFTDQEFDGETGLYNYDARLYDPVIGVFVSADSIIYGGGFDPQMLNRYSYVRNNPLKYTDPNGHFAISSLIGIAAVGAIIYEWVSPSTANAPDVGDPQYNSDSLSKTATKMAAGASIVVGAAIALEEIINDESEISPNNRDLLDEARAARDQKATELGPKRPQERPATVTAGYNEETGEIAVGCSGRGQCAEMNAEEILGIDNNVIRFTEAVRPRPHGPPFREVPICRDCEERYGRDQFPEGTQFQSDEEEE